MFLDMVNEQPVEKHLVRVLQGAQIHMPGEVVVVAAKRLEGAGSLLLERLDDRWQQAIEPELSALL